MTDKNLKTLIVLFKTQKNLNRHIKKSLQGSGLSVNEFAALEALYNKGDLSVNELLNYVLIPNSSMTYVVSSLTKKGYIEDYLKPTDQRIKCLKISSVGRVVFTRAYEKHYVYIRKQFDVLTSEEEAQLVTLLKKLGHSLEGSI